MSVRIPSAIAKCMAAWRMHVTAAKQRRVRLHRDVGGYMRAREGALLVTTFLNWKAAVADERRCVA